MSRCLENDVQRELIGSIQVKRTKKSVLARQCVTFMITFITYMSFHCQRSSYSFVKPILIDKKIYQSSELGMSDFTFLLFYSIGSYLLGWIGDRVDLRLFILVSSLVTAVVQVVITMVDNCWLLYGLMVLNGLGQSMAWPGLIAIMGNWIKYSNRATVMGVWAGCANIGNIVGVQIASYIVYNLQYSWKEVFYSSAIILLTVGILQAIIVQPYPDRLSIQIEDNQQYQQSSSQYQCSQQQQIDNEQINDNMKWTDYLKIKGLLRYCVGYLGVKSSTYGLLFWLPNYLYDHGMESESSSIVQLYEISQFIGALLVGLMLDRVFKSHKSIVLPPCLLVCSISYFLIPRFNYVESYYILLIVSGLMIGPPYNLISSCITADLGKTSNLNRNAVSTVTSIIEGSGSMGAALTMILIPYISQFLFYLLSIFTLLSSIFFIPPMINDIKQLIRPSSS